MTQADVARRPRLNLGIILNGYSLLIAVLPIAIVVFIALNLFGDQAQDQAENQLISLAEVKTREIDNWLETSQTTLSLVLTNPEEYRRMADIVGSPGGAVATSRRVTQFLDEQLGLQDAYEEFFLYDLEGDVRISTDESQVEVNLVAEGQPYVQDGFRIYEGLLAAGTTRIRPRIYPTYLDPTRDTMEIIITHPLVNETNDVVGAIAGRLSLDTLSDIMTTRVGLGDTGETYLVSSVDSRLVTPSRFEDVTANAIIDSVGVQRGIAQEEGASFYANYRADEVIGVYRYLPRLEAALIAEITEAEALSAVEEVRTASLIVAVITGISVLLIGYGMARWITRPIGKLTSVAESVLRGDYSQRADLAVVTEIGQLGNAFDTMTSDLLRSIEERNERIQQIEELSSTLESRVQARTRDLRVAADVSRQVTTVLDIDELLQKVVTLTVISFDLYASLVYRVDETDPTRLQLAAGVDTDGNTIELGEMATIPLTAEPSLIARAARERTRQVANDVTASATYLPHEALPETQSEIAIPLRLGGRLLGIFDLQSRYKDRFTPEDMDVLRTLAEQISVAMRNAQLYTEAQGARAAAEQADQVKSQFLANMSHELRTPLNAILNFTEFVADGVLGEVNDEQVDALNKAIDSSEHLLSLINDILDLTKIEVGMMELFIEQVDLNKVIESVLATGKGLVKDKPQVTIITDIQPDLPPLAGDKRRLRQVLLNLVSNAIKFTPEGEVRVRAHHRDGEIEIAVQDTGVGIPQADQALVFESFRQSEGGLSSGLGTGLGLPISRHLVEAHSGQLTLESTVNIGTTFTVHLPIREVEQPG